MLRIGVVGAGNIGYHHCRVVASEGTVRLGAVIDINQAAALRCVKDFGGAAFSTLKGALAVTELDALVVAAPTQFHTPLVLEGLQQNLHILVEKPAAADPDDARWMLREALIRNRILATGQVERFNPAVLYAKKMIESGVLGSVTQLVSQRVGGFPPGQPAAGVLSDLGIHDLDVFYFLLGTHPKAHRATTRSITGKVADSASLFLDYGAASGFIQVNWITPVKIRRLSITGTLGYAEVDYIAQEVRSYRRNVNAADFTEHSFEDFYRKYAKPEADAITLKGDEPLMNQFRAFLRDVRNGHQHFSVAVSEVVPSLEIIRHYDHPRT